MGLEDEQLDKHSGSNSPTRQTILILLRGISECRGKPIHLLHGISTPFGTLFYLRALQRENGNFTLRKP